MNIEITKTINLIIMKTQTIKNLIIVFAVLVVVIVAATGIYNATHIDYSNIICK